MNIKTALLVMHATLLSTPALAHSGGHSGFSISDLLQHFFHSPFHVAVPVLALFCLITILVRTRMKNGKSE